MILRILALIPILTWAIIHDVFLRLRNGISALIARVSAYFDRIANETGHCPYGDEACTMMRPCQRCEDANSW